MQQGPAHLGMCVCTADPKGPKEMHLGVWPRPGGKSSSGADPAWRSCAQSPSPARARLPAFPAARRSCRQFGASCQLLLIS